MKFFRNLFKSEKTNVEYIESRPQHTEVDVQSLKKSEIKPFLQENLSPDYWEDSSQISLSELSNISSLEETMSRLTVLEQCLNVTNQGLFLEVMDHYDQFLTGLDNIQNINILLDQSQTLASESRLEVMSMQNDLKKKYLRITYLKKRHLRLEGLIKELNNFKDICYAVSLSIKEAVRSGNLFQALELCNEATDYIKTMDVSRYLALAGVLEKAEKRKGKIYVKMKASLRELCHKFDPHLYENVLLSYMTIASYEDINKAIQAEFMHSINRLIKESIETITPHLPSSSIEQMLKMISSSNYIPSIRLIYKNLTTLMYSHHLLSRWHEENEYFLNSVSEQNSYPVTQKFMKNLKKFEEIQGFYVEIKMSLLKNRKFIWEKIQQILAKIVKESEQIQNLTQGEIRKFLSWTNIFIEIGEDFSGLTCNELRAELSSKCRRFFDIFHLTNVNRLVSVLEVEQWTRLPIPKDFELSTELSKNVQRLQPLFALIESFSEYSFSFSKLVQGNPFDEDLAGVDLCEEDGLKLTFSGIGQGENSPVLCTTGMNLLKALSSYIELSYILTPVSYEVFSSLTNLLEIFVSFNQFYECFRIFVQDSAKYQLFIELTDKEVTGDQLEASYDTFLFQGRYNSIKVNITRIKAIIDSLPGECGGLLKQLHKQVITQISLAKAIIAVQTCKNLLFAVSSASDVLKRCVSHLHHDSIDLFIAQSSLMVNELEDFIVSPILSKSLGLEWLSSSITGARWEELKTENSQFVSRLFHIVDDFKQKLVSLGGGSIPESIQQRVLKKVVHICVEVMLEAFAKVKRSNQQGREQMKKDLKEFCDASESLLTLVPLERQYHWQEFLEIWSSPAENVVDWILKNTNLSLKLHRSICNTGLHMMSLSKSARSSHIINIEGQYRQLMFRPNS